MLSRSKPAAINLRQSFKTGAWLTAVMPLALQRVEPTSSARIKDCLFCDLGLAVGLLSTSIDDVEPCALPPLYGVEGAAFFWFTLSCARLAAGAREKHR